MEAKGLRDTEKRSEIRYSTILHRQGIQFTPGHMNGKKNRRQVDNNKRVTAWIDSILSEISQLDDNKGIDILFNKFKEEFYSSGKITKTGNVISLIFEECTCPIVKNGVNNSFLCNCTTAYSKRLFEILFDREVSVDLEQSILNGDSICKQIIRIKD